MEKIQNVRTKSAFTPKKKKFIWVKFVLCFWTLKQIHGCCVFFFFFFFVDYVRN